MLANSMRRLVSVHSKKLRPNVARFSSNTTTTGSDKAQLQEWKKFESFYNKMNENGQSRKHQRRIWFFIGLTGFVVGRMSHCSSGHDCEKKLRRKDRKKKLVQLEEELQQTQQENVQLRQSLDTMNNNNFQLKINNKEIAMEKHRDKELQNNNFTVVIGEKEYSGSLKEMLLYGTQFLNSKLEEQVALEKQNGKTKEESQEGTIVVNPHLKQEEVEKEECNK